MNLPNFGRKNREQVKELEIYTAFLEVHLDQFRAKKGEIPEDLFVVTEFLLEEIIDMYQSMKVLYRKDHFRTCLILARSILESSINLRYIYKEDREKRASNFRRFSTKEYLKRAEKVKDITPEGKEMLDLLKKIAEAYTPSAGNKRHWDGKSVREKSEEIGMGRDYEIYSHLSTYLHGNFRGNRDLSIQRPYNNNLRKIVSRDLLLFVTETLKVIAEAFDLDGGIIHMDYGDKLIIFATNPKRASAQ